MNPPRPPRERQGVRRAVVFLPNGFTLFNLFCGIYAMVLASRGEFPTATMFIVLGGFADALDGRVARATGTGSRMGEELDSLVDAISFGLAPAMIMYFAELSKHKWAWLLVFIFTSCAVMRLARFNVEQAGRKKTHFHGLPSPAAGMTLASFFWFATTDLYKYTVIWFTDEKMLSDLPWPTIMMFLMAVLAALMISPVPYAAVPTVGYKTTKQRLGSLLVIGTITGLLLFRQEFIFPALLAYVLYGVLQAFILGLIGRVRQPDEIYWGAANGGAMTEVPRHSRPGPVVTPVSTPAPLSDGDILEDDDGGVDRMTERERSQRRRKRRRNRGQRPGPPFPPPEPPRDPEP